MKPEVFRTTLLAVVMVAAPVSHADDYVLYLLRHAEKADTADMADMSGDPGLTAAGEARAEALAGWLAERDVRTAWSSDYRRTRATIAPLLRRSGIPLDIYAADDQAGLAGELQAQAQTAVVVGHSNTIPELASLLCECEVAPMPESEYDRLLIIRRTAQGSRLETVDQRELFALPDRP